MKKILISLSIMLLFIMSFTSCVTSAAVATDDIYVSASVDESIYYNDALYVDYEIVWVGRWPYWYRNNVFIPYHHTHVLHRHPRHFERRPYKPHLIDNHYHYKHQKELHNPRKIHHNNSGWNGTPSRGRAINNRRDNNIHHDNHGNNSRNSRSITPNTRRSQPVQRPQRHYSPQPQTRHTTPHSNTRMVSSPGSRMGSSSGSHGSNHSVSRGGRR